VARVWRVGAPWHARARRGEARWARPRGDRGSLSRSRLLPRGREDERAPFRDPRGGERKSDLRCPLFVDRRGGETRDGLTRDARVVNARSAYLEFVGHGVGSAARAKFWPGPRPASADARSARFSEGCRKPETKTFFGALRRSWSKSTAPRNGAFPAVAVAAFPASDVSRAERVRLSVDSGRSQPRRSPGVPATPSATPCRDGLRVRRGLARHRATERAISARVRVAGGKSGSAESGRPEPSRALRARRGRVQGPNRRRRRGGENLDRRRTPARGRAHGPDPRGASVSARRAASRPHLLYFPLAGAFPRLRCERAILARTKWHRFAAFQTRAERKNISAGAREGVADGASVERRRRWESRLVFWSRRFS
jgi:hypothetical protein